MCECITNCQQSHAARTNASKRQEHTNNARTPRVNASRISHTNETIRIGMRQDATSYKWETTPRVIASRTARRNGSCSTYEWVKRQEHTNKSRTPCMNASRTSHRNKSRSFSCKRVQVFTRRVRDWFTCHKLHIGMKHVPFPARGYEDLHVKILTHSYVVNSA